MGTPSDVIDLSTLYMRIYFIGMPFFMLYNYGAAILRAVGDTKRPLIFLIISGVVNAALNLTLVIGAHLGVAGVAIGTVVSQCLSCILYAFACLKCVFACTLQHFVAFQTILLRNGHINDVGGNRYETH